MVLWLARAMLVMTGMGIFVIANMPSAMVPFGSSNDVVNHAIAFAVLAIVVVAAFPSARPLVIFMGLMAFNTAIEFSQKALGFGRQADVGDWLVGALAAAIVLASWAVFKQIQRLIAG